MGTPPQGLGVDERPVSGRLASGLGGWKAEKKKGARPFRLDETQLDAYLAQRCLDVFWISGTKSMAMLQAFHYFVDYLVAHEYLSPADAGFLQSAGARLFETAREAVDACDPAYRLCPTWADVRPPVP